MKAGLSVTQDCSSIASVLAKWALGFDAELARLCPAVDRSKAVESASGEAKLIESMRYSLLSPGKRIRPYLVCRCASLLGADECDAYPAAAALECVHAFSLIHDDLPAMDDDELRRGRPTNHVKFGEATAILAGDALLAYAFELIAGHESNAERSQRMVLELARAVGYAGMIGGQAVDIAGEGASPDQSLLDTIHSLKTAKLFECACRLGAMVADTDNNAVSRLGEYGACLGRAFQIADDVLDQTATTEDLGKSSGKDAPSGKLTYPRCVGIDGSRQAAAEFVDSAVAALSHWGDEADELRRLARYVVQRRS